MANNIIDFNAIRDKKILDNLDLTEMGSITITIKKENLHNYAIFSILPSTKEFDPIVDVIYNALNQNTFKFITKKGA